jgi:hypothetical protein
MIYAKSRHRAPTVLRIMATASKALTHLMSLSCRTDHMTIS